MERKLNLGLVGLLVLAGFAITVLLAVTPANAGITGDPPPMMVGADWNINNPTHVWDQDVFIFDGDVNINSKLTLHNASIYMGIASVFDQHDINVAATGTIEANDSHIAPFNWYYDIYSSGTIDMERCTVDSAWNFSLDGRSKFYNRTMISEIEYAYLDGTVTIDDNSYLDWVYYDLKVSGTVTVSDNSHVRYIPADLDITGTATFDRSEIYEIYGICNVSGTLDMDSSYLTNLYRGLINTGTLDLYQVSGREIYNGIVLDGVTAIDHCDFTFVYEGVDVMNDKVSITNTDFLYMYDRGFHFYDCDASLNNVTIDVMTGVARGYFKTDHIGDYDHRYPMGIGIGIWVEGGNPSFVDVDVEADGEAEFNLEWTGTEADVTIYTRALAAAVLIDSTEMTAVSGLTIHDSYFDVTGRFTATNPGINPMYFHGYMDVISAGLAVANYDRVTITKVDVYSNQYGSIYGPYMYGAYYYGNGYRSYGPRIQVLAAIVGDYSASPDPSLTLTGVDVMDGSNWFLHYYEPSYSGTGVPTFGDTVLVNDVTVTSAYNPVFMFQIMTSFTDARNFDLDTRVTNSHFEGLYGPLMYYDFWPGPADRSMATIDISESLMFDNNTITQSYYYWAYLEVGSSGDTMPLDTWDKVFTIADNEFVETMGTFFYAWAQWSFVKGSDEIHVLNNNMADATNVYDGPFYVDGFDTVRFIDNTLTDMAYPETGDFYDYGGDTNGIKPVDWLFKDNTWDNCTNARWSEVIFLEYGGDVVFESNEIKNQNGLVSFMQVSEYTGSSSMDIHSNDFHDNMAYFAEYGDPDPTFRNFVMTITDNDVYNNADYFLNYWGRTSTLNNFDYDGIFVIEGNDVHDNSGGFIHAWGNVSVMNNTFTSNEGPLLYIDYINLHTPIIKGNVYVDNVNLFTFVGKEKGYQFVTIEMSDLSLTCSGTALSFINFEVTLNNVDITNAATSVSARNAYVDAYSCNIDGDTCEVLGDGLITTWWPMEVYVSWGDENGMDSGTPVVAALVVFNTLEGDYYSSEYADVDGMLPEELFSAWYVDPAGVHWYSPYKMKVAASGATNDMDVTLDKDLIGEDMVHLVLWDVFKPMVAITEPYSGIMFNVDSVETYGFIAEVGSGLDTAEYSIDDGDTWTPLAVDDMGDWLLPLSDLPEGEVSLMVRATDIAGNVGMSTVVMTIDTTPPALSISALPEVTNFPTLPISGSVEVGSEVFVNGKSLGIWEDSALAIDHILYEGSNLIILEAVDEAGNVATETATVLLDTFDPHLVIYGPAGGTITNADTIEVWGMVEVGATLTVGGTQVMPNEAGRFTHDYTLEDGENSIEVKATDVATNANIVTIVVHQDQDPPYLEVREPADGTVTNQDLITVHIITDDDAVLWLNGRRLTTTGDVTTNILLLEGENMVKVKAMDPAGNEEIVTVNVIRDTEPPSLVVTKPDAMEIWTNVMALDIEGVALKATSVKAGDQTATYDPVTGIFSISASLFEGRNNVTVEASDGVNTVSTTITVWVNRNAPVLNVDAVEHMVKTPSVTISGSTEVGIDIVTVVVSDVPSEHMVEYDGTFAVTLNLADGDYDIKVMATDVYGNTAEQSTGTFTVKSKDYLPDGEEEEGPAVEPLHIGLILAVIGIALIIAAYASAHYITRRRREELEESY